MDQNITAAVKALRKNLGETQQQFANRLGLAISSVVRYEAGNKPAINVLLKLARLAEQNGWSELADAFDSVMRQDVGAVAYREALNVKALILDARVALIHVPDYQNIPSVVEAMRKLGEATALVNAMDPFTPDGEK